MNQMPDNRLMNFEEIVDQLKTLEPEKIIPFGSQATGEALDDSDIDIALFKDTTLPFHERLIEARRLLRTTMPVNLFVFTNEEIEANQVDPPFIQEILRTGKIIYGE